MWIPSFFISTSPIKVGVFSFTEALKYLLDLSFIITIRNLIVCYILKIRYEFYIQNFIRIQN